MRSVGPRRSARPGTSSELVALRVRLAEAEETLHAIRSGGVDALVVAGQHGPRVYTLDGAEHAYRILIESMNEGALTVTAGGVILYANESFARIVRRPLESIMGRSFEGLLSTEDQAAFQSRLKRKVKTGSRFQVLFRPGDGSGVPAQISIRQLPKNGSRAVTFGMVVTDMTETQRNKMMLRDLSYRLAQAQESERGHLALELTDDVTQSLVGILFRLQTLVDKLPEHERPQREEVAKIDGLLSEAARKVERISRRLLPRILVNLGLAAALRAASEEFAKRTGMRIEVSCAPLSPPPAAEARLVLYRIFEEALRNVEKHAGAHQVTVRLTQRGAHAQLAIRDDGVGFDSKHVPAKGKEDGLGLLRIRDRAEFLGGVLTVKSGVGRVTELKVRIPLTGGSAATD